MKNLHQPIHAAVVFDLGNVIVGWDPFLPLADQMSRDQWNQFSQDADFFVLNSMADSGVPLEKVIALAAKKNRHHADLIRHYFDNFDRSLTGPVAGVTDIVDELRVGGLRLLGLTNWSAETFHHARKSTSTIDQLEAIMVSGREGLAKPDPSIFRRLIVTYALTPEQTVFIDDSPPNVQAASELGFTAIKFTDANQLREDLKQIEILG